MCLCVFLTGGCIYPHDQYCIQLPQSYHKNLHLYTVEKIKIFTTYSKCTIIYSHILYLASLPQNWYCDTDKKKMLKKNNLVINIYSWIESHLLFRFLCFFSHFYLFKIFKCIKTIIIGRNKYFFRMYVIWFFSYIVQISICYFLSNFQSCFKNFTNQKTKSKSLTKAIAVL